MDDVSDPLSSCRSVHRTAVDRLPLHHQVEDRRDADLWRREAARRAPRRRPPARRPTVHDRTHHDRGKSRIGASNACPAAKTASACSRTASEMAYDRYPRRRNVPIGRSRSTNRPDYYSEQPASRTRFYRDKRHGKVSGVCAGIADYTGFDVSLVRVCFLAAMFMSGGGILPFYFIAAMVTPTKPLRSSRSTATSGSSGKASGLADPGCARHPLADEGHRPPARRY